MEDRVKTVSAALAVAVLVFPSLAQAEEYFINAGTAGLFEIRPDETESDALLRAACVAHGYVDLRFGAYFGVGEGKLEPVSVKLSAGKMTAGLKGVSVESQDAEMTGGTELLTSVPIGSAALSILTQGGTVSVEFAGGRKDRFELGEETSDAFKAFLETCRKDGPNWR